MLNYLKEQQRVDKKPIRTLVGNLCPDEDVHIRTTGEEVQQHPVGREDTVLRRRPCELDGRAK